MCDVESYMYMPMLEELGYVPTHPVRVRRGDPAPPARRSPTTSTCVSDALFHTGVTQAEWDEDAARWRIRTDRGDELTGRYYVLAVGLLNLLKLPAISGHGGLRRAVVPHRALGLRGHRRRARASRSPSSATRSSGSSAPVPPASSACRRWRRRPSTSSCSSARRRRSASAATDPPIPTSPPALEPGWQQARMDNFQAIMLGKPVDVDLVDDGWTQHYAAVHHPPEGGHASRSTCAAPRSSTSGSWRSTGGGSRSWWPIPATAEILKPHYRYLCKRPCFHDEFLERVQQRERHPRRLPGRLRPGDRAGSGGRRPASTRSTCLIYGTGFEPEVTPALPAGRPPDHRAGRPQPGREVRATARPPSSG